MKKYIIVFFTVIIFCVSVYAQDDSRKIYTTTSGELIFSFADINYEGSETGSVMRFSPVVNIQNWVNIDKSDKFGLFTGLSLRNIGFIYDVPNTTTRMKYRTYNIGIPVGVKIGNLSDKFLFFGYELEIPVNYKEKYFLNEDKEDKKSIWFSDRVTTFNHSLMAGVQLPYGATLKFKYYLSNFFNKDFEETVDNGQGGTMLVKPYENSDYNVFYFSLSFGLLKNADFYYNNE